MGPRAPRAGRAPCASPVLLGGRGRMRGHGAGAGAPAPPPQVASVRGKWHFFSKHRKNTGVAGETARGWMF